MNNVVYVIKIKDGVSGEIIKPNFTHSEVALQTDNLKEAEGLFRLIFSQFNEYKQKTRSGKPILYIQGFDKDSYSPIYINLSDFSCPFIADFIGFEKNGNFNGYIECPMY